MTVLEKQLDEYEKALSKQKEAKDIAILNINRLEGAIIAINKIIEERDFKQTIIDNQIKNNKEEK